MAKFKVLLRISDAGYNKEKIDWATKEVCLKNTLEVFGIENVMVFPNACKAETLAMIAATGVAQVPIEGGSGAASFRQVADFAFSNFGEEDAVYFLEDDYLHWPNAAKVLEEGLGLADYVTLYDHPDKYLLRKDGGNPLLKDGAEISAVMRTANAHWKFTNSTTMTFACKIGTLKRDWAIWKKYTADSHPHDFLIFKTLTQPKYFYRRRGIPLRKLASPIPGFSTHTELKWLSPGRNWNELQPGDRKLF